MTETMHKRVFKTYLGWRHALRFDFPSSVFEGNSKSCKAFGYLLDVKKALGEWDGIGGYVEY